MQLNGKEIQGMTTTEMLPKESIQMEEQDEDEPEDEDIEFYNYMSGDVYYEDIP